MKPLTNHFTKRGEVCFHNTSVTSPLFIQVSVPSHECERSGICVLEVSNLPFFGISMYNCLDSVMEKGLVGGR